MELEGRVCVWLNWLRVEWGNFALTMFELIPANKKYCKNAEDYDNYKFWQTPADSIFPPEPKTKM